ncbi:uncharacterized protein LOC114752578 [Neltuma alba]|uniref:uncharacterized protein LOC114752578 n=1 Tax=Neltuma alba TaxID=207710 RepID=UPI0010A358A6|nr:uncharacterized protein LOC114752578 [Prosopis alba]XP_028797159.1 uncharacterized protein LOC114752578 [Prosopis alba]XP_028797160.1 uncharacterized protein LOC114752578 [Prosopis alba]
MPLADSHRDSLAGLTLDDVLANRAAASSHQLTNNRRTLLDIIREDESSKKDRKSWKAFKDKLRLKRAGSAWTSSILIPASDIPFPIRNNRNLATQFPRRSSVRVLTFSPVDVTTHCMADPTEEAIKSSHLAPMITRQRSTRQVGDAVFVDDKLKPQMSRPNSARLVAAVRADSIRRERVVTFRDSIDSDDDEDGDGHQPREGRQMSAREAVAAQEAAEAAAMAGEEDEEDEEEGSFGAGGGGVTMSLMDLLEETDRQMGLEGSTYRMEDDDDDDFDEDEEDDEGGEEHDCCVCMVKHRGPAFEPCGHSFCRMCSRELTVSKGNCPLCNNFILEILEVF